MREHKFDLKATSRSRIASCWCPRADVKNHQPFPLPLASIVAASISGFLVVNYPSGRIFLCDGGAYLVGLLLAEISVLLVHRNSEVSPWFPLVLLAYPIWETLFSMYRRKRRGQSTGHAGAFTSMSSVTISAVGVGGQAAGAGTATSTAAGGVGLGTAATIGAAAAAAAAKPPPRRTTRLSVLVNKAPNRARIATISSAVG